MKKLIEVTANDIGMGKPCIAHDCPIARAFKRCTGAVRAAVYDAVSFGYFDRDLYTIPLPPEAIKFRQRFDQGKSVKPFSFTVDL